MAIIALMEHELVRKRKLIRPDEFVRGVGLSQILGPFAVNTALFIGYQVYGPVGGLISATAFMAPSLVLVLAFSRLYFSYHTIPALQGAVAGLAPIVIALIVSAAWSMGRKELRSWFAVLICGLAIIAGLYKVNPAYVLVAAGVIGLATGSRSLKVEKPPQIAGTSSRDPMHKTFGGGGIFLSPLSLPLAGSAPFAQIALTFFSIGLVFFGGGFVLVPVLHQTLVVKLGWLTSREFIDGVAICNLTPGPISVLATFAGYRLRGVFGAILATAALYLPAVIVMLVLCHQYERLKDRRETQAFLGGIIPAVVGLVLSTAILLAGATLHSWRTFAFACLALLLLTRWKFHPALILGIGAFAGYARILP